MIIIVNAQIYTLEKGSAVAYEIEYSDGTRVRSVESKDNFIRSEYKSGDEWISQKPYVVQHNKKRNAERTKETVKEFLNK